MSKICFKHFYRIKKQNNIIHIINLLLLLSTLSFTTAIWQNFNTMICNKNGSNTYNSFNPLRDNSQKKFNTPFSPKFELLPFQTPHILFIVGDPINIDPIYDKPFYDYLTNNLTYSVSYFDDDDVNNSVKIYENYDAILISSTIVEENTVNELYNASIPIFTMEGGTYNEFGFTGAGFGILQGIQSINIVDINHSITSHLQIGAYPVTNSSMAIEYFKKPFPTEVQGLAAPSTATKPPENSHRSLMALDKGKIDINNNPAVERRAFFGASQGLYLNASGWNLWTHTLKWILYDDNSGQAQIIVNVKDTENNNIENARVDLVNSYNASKFYTNLNTTVSGNVTFLNVPFGLYNLTIFYKSIINNTLTYLQITGNYTYVRTANFEYSINLDIYLDETPPSAQNIRFDGPTSSFFADIFDESLITSVLLNLTAINATGSINPGSIELSDNYTMLLQSGNTYYNSTALESLTHTSVEIFYNIIATDIANNTLVTQIKSFILNDPDAPFIWFYNVTDYGNGTLQYYANITDKSEISIVTLKINESYHIMTKNSSNYWVFKTQRIYNTIFNFTIYSVNDSFNKFNGSSIGPIAPQNFIIFRTKDTLEPHIWGVTDPRITHYEGYGEFTAYVDDWNSYQSGLNISSVTILININNSPENESYTMILDGVLTFRFAKQFNYTDNITYWIQATDKVGNKNLGQPHNFIIGDNSYPIVSYSAFEWGNGTVDFHAEIFDWPLNNVSAYVIFTQNWFGSWSNGSMNKITESNFTFRYSNFLYSARKVWFYVIAFDSENNSNNPTIDQAYDISLSDIIPPQISFNIEYSGEEDGRITIIAQAIDIYGDFYFVNNTFKINITSQVQNLSYIDMVYSSLFTYSYSHSFYYNDNISLTVFVSDDAGNVGISTKNYIIQDLVPPKIKNWGIKSFQNGSVVIWCEVQEGLNGSGLASNNAVLLNYIFINPSTVSMIWNGTYYTYSIQGFEPGNGFSYQIIAIDNSENSYITTMQAFTIIDSTSPHFLDYSKPEDISFDEKETDYTFSELTFWVIAYDPFGTMEGVNITIKQFNGSEWLNYTDEMTFFNSRFIYSKIFFSNTIINYSFTAFDKKVGGLPPNINKTIEYSFRTSNFHPASIKDYGIEYQAETVGYVTFWTEIIDQFNNHSSFLSVYDNSSNQWLLKDVLMGSNITHQKYNLKIKYKTNFTYYITLYDSGVYSGFYEKTKKLAYAQMDDKWGPNVNDFGYTEINKRKYLIWANVSDLESGISQVLFLYSFNEERQVGGGIGTSILSFTDSLILTFNGTMYTAEIEFSQNGRLNGTIQAMDNASNFNTDWEAIWKPWNITSPSGLTFLDIVFAVLVTIGIILSLFVSITVLQRVKKKKTQVTQTYIEKLDLIENIFSILVSTDSGIPIYSINNARYQSTSDLNLNLSGLSVGIDSFLDTFQSEYIGQIEQKEQLSLAKNEKGSVRLSVIEQNKIQIMILATTSYRIFVFLKEKPTSFTRYMFISVIRDLQDNLIIEDSGVIDEVSLEPKVKEIIKKYVPIALLVPWTIDLERLRSFEKDRKDKRMSQGAIEALKKLCLTQVGISTQLMKDPQALVKMFDDLPEMSYLRTFGKFLFSDALRIMEKLFNVQLKHIYEALWVGSESDIEIIKPY